jgi:hypothetical protein
VKAEIVVASTYTHGGFLRGTMTGFGFGMFAPPGTPTFQVPGSQSFNAGFKFGRNLASAVKTVFTGTP